jgi:ATP-binding cassette, subfamily A (ABC1), member 3
MIEKVGLSSFVNTKAGALSGGNKRKLCLSMAMIGRPKVMYIDEASAGVDPASRRKMWTAIQDEGKDSAVVITTHAMEEAESLAQNIGIMVDGRFKCYGTLSNI